MLELGRAALEHEEALCAGAVAQLREQPRLADAGLAADRQQEPAATRDGVERAVDRRELRLASRKAHSAHPNPQGRGDPRC